MQARTFGSIVWDSRLFVAVVAGWTAYDLSWVAMSGEGYLVPKLLPGYVVAVLAAAVVGVYRHYAVATAATTALPNLILIVLDMVSPSRMFQVGRISDY